MAVQGVDERVQGGILFEQILFVAFYFFLERQYWFQLIAGIAHLAGIDRLEEQSDVIYLIFFVQLFRRFPFFFYPRGEPRTRRRTPAVVQHEHRVVALPEVVVDQRLRPSHAADRVLPADRVEQRVPGFGVVCREFLQRGPEALAFLVQSAWRGNEHPVLRQRLWHPAPFAPAAPPERVGGRQAG